jgi:hypothetical protein
MAVKNGGQGLNGFEKSAFLSRIQDYENKKEKGLKEKRKI